MFPIASLVQLHVHSHTHASSFWSQPRHREQSSVYTARQPDAGCARFNVCEHHSCCNPRTVPWDVPEQCLLLRSCLAHTAASTVASSKYTSAPTLLNCSDISAMPVCAAHAFTPVPCHANNPCSTEQARPVKLCMPLSALEAISHHQHQQQHSIIYYQWPEQHARCRACSPEQPAPHQSGAAAHTPLAPV